MMQLLILVTMVAVAQAMAPYQQLVTDCPGTSARLFHASMSLGETQLVNGIQTYVFKVSYGKSDNASICMSDIYGLPASASHL